MLKSTAGGGGIGIRLCRSGEGIAPGVLTRFGHLSQSHFGKAGGVYLERFVSQAPTPRGAGLRGTGRGSVAALGERELLRAAAKPRRFIEETPAPGLGERGQGTNLSARRCDWRRRVKIPVCGNGGVCLPIWRAAISIS